MKAQFQKLNDAPVADSEPGSSKSEQAARRSNARRSRRDNGTARFEPLCAKPVPDHDLSGWCGHAPDADDKALEPMKFFSINQVAEILNVSDRTVRRWIKSGELVAHHLGGVVRIAESDLKNFIDRHRGK